MTMQAHDSTPTTERVAEMLFDIYQNPHLQTDNGERLSMTRELHRLAEFAGVTPDKSREGKPPTYRAVVAAGRADIAGAVASFERRVLGVWTRAETARLAATPEAEDLETIREVYEGSGGVSRGDRRNLSAAINQAADRAGIGRLSLSYPERYEQAERALRGTPYYATVGHIHHLCEQIREVWDRPADVPAAAVYEARGAKKARKRRPRQHIFTLTRDTPHIGFVRGETVEATETASLKVWDIAVAQKEGETAGIGRVVAVGADSITIRRAGGGDVTVPRRGLAFLGRVNPEPIGKADDLTDEQRESLKKLRAKLDALAGEDDQILRCTARYEIEKQIFDIEHPAGGDPDDWSQWEEK